MDILLKNILNIKKHNKFLTYIVDRVTRDDYRGHHKSQHNRYDIDKFEKIIKTIHKVVGENNFSIPSGDTSKDRKKLAVMKSQHPEFNEIYQILKSAKIFRAPDPIRKNFFVEFSRLGFIEKYDSQGNKLDPFRRTHTKTVKLSEIGIRFLQAKTVVEKHKVFTEGVEKLLGNTLVDLVAAISLSDYKKDSFDFE